MSDLATDPTQTADAPQQADGRRFNPFTALVWTAVLTVLALLGWGLVNNNIARPQVGDPAPNVTVHFFDDYQWQSAPTAELDDLHGRVVVLNFWASWCLECTYEADDLQAVWDRYSPEEVVVLGVAYTDIDSESVAFLREFGITYPNGPDLGLEISNRFVLSGVPETFVIDQNGRVTNSYIGPVTAEQLTTTIDRLLASSPTFE